MRQLLDEDGRLGVRWDILYERKVRSFVCTARDFMTYIYRVALLGRGKTRRLYSQVSWDL